MNWASNGQPAYSGIGTHCILELYGCPAELLDDEQRLMPTLREAALRAGATLLKETMHRFEPQGITALLLLAESHLSIHTWPESGYAAVDVFTCGSHTQPEVACAFLVQACGATQHSLKVVTRRPPVQVNQTEREPVAL